ncbi:MAG: hypothetical protein ACFE7R_02405, partial [Candidatus Hodarchaeota archaeon]
MSATVADQKRMGMTTIISSLILVAMLVWASYSFLLVQFGNVRQYDPHIDYDDAPFWGYNINWSGGRTNWFEDVNYTDLPLDEFLPEDLLDQMNNTVFYVSPEDPPQLWRSTAYDRYDGSRWTKSSVSPYPLTDGLIDRATAESLGNQIYRIYLNLTAGPNVGSIELPTLFPEILVIEDSFESGEIIDGTYQVHDPTRLLSYDLDTDQYGTVIFSPFLEGETGESV